MAWTYDHIKGIDMFSTSLCCDDDYTQKMLYKNKVVDGSFKMDVTRRVSKKETVPTNRPWFKWWLPKNEEIVRHTTETMSRQPNFAYYCIACDRQCETKDLLVHDSGNWSLFIGAAEVAAGSPKAGTEGAVPSAPAKLSRYK